MTKKETLAYVAGLMDGEGYIRISINKSRQFNLASRNPTYQLYVGINMCDPRAIKIIHKNFKGSFHTKKKYNNPNHRTLYGWVCCSRNAYNFIMQIRPYLIVKADEADVAIEFQTHIDSCGRQWNTKKRLPKHIIDYRESLFNIIRHLKHVKHLA